MEADFVNMFIQKQKAMIDDLAGRVVMLDTRATIAEAKVEKIGEMETTIADLKKQVNTLTVERENLKQQLSNIKKAAQS